MKINKHNNSQLFRVDFFINFDTKMKDVEKDPNYWILFDEDIKDLPVDNILLGDE